MGFEADGVAIAGLLECAELGDPVGQALAYGGPLEAVWLGSGWLGDCALYVAVADAVFGD